MHIRSRESRFNETEPRETEAKRKQRIMNDPIEALVMKTNSYLSD